MTGLPPGVRYLRSVHLNKMLFDPYSQNISLLSSDANEPDFFAIRAGSSHADLGSESVPSQGTPS